jgi:hypothetical protein
MFKDHNSICLKLTNYDSLIKRICFSGSTGRVRKCNFKKEDYKSLTKCVQRFFPYVWHVMPRLMRHPACLREAAPAKAGLCFPGFLLSQE